VNWLGKLFSSTGDASMKRVIAFSALVTAIVYTFVHPGEPKADPVTLGVWTGLMVSMMVAAAATKT